MTIEQLLEEADRATPPTSGRFCISRLIPVIDKLRRQKFTWAQIWQFFHERGEPIHKTPSAFTSAASKAHLRWIEKQRRQAMTRK